MDSLAQLQAHVSIAGALAPDVIALAAWSNDDLIRAMVERVCVRSGKDQCFVGWESGRPRYRDVQAIDPLDEVVVVDLTAWLTEEVIPAAPGQFTFEIMIDDDRALTATARIRLIAPGAVILRDGALLACYRLTVEQD